MVVLRCRALRLSDLPEVLVLDQICFGGLWTQEGYRREFHSPNSDLLVLEAQQPHTNRFHVVGIGCLWAILDEAHITVLGVAPGYQGNGLGQWLLLHLLRASRDRGLTHATLEVRRSNQSAQTLYAKFGFTVIGERRKYYSDGEDALILWRNDLQSTPLAAQWQQVERQLLSRLAEQGWQLSSPQYSKAEG